MGSLVLTFSRIASLIVYFMQFQVMVFTCVLSFRVVSGYPRAGFFFTTFSVAVASSHSTSAWN